MIKLVFLAAVVVLYFLWTHAVVEKTSEKFGQVEKQGVAPVDIVEGMIGSDARVLGAASLPFLADFSQDRELLFRING